MDKRSELCCRCRRFRCREPTDGHICQLQNSFIKTLTPIDIAAHTFQAVNCRQSIGAVSGNVVLQARVGYKRWRTAGRLVHVDIIEYRWNS